MIWYLERGIKGRNHREYTHLDGVRRADWESPAANRRLHFPQYPAAPTQPFTAGTTLSMMLCVESAFMWGAARCPLGSAVPGWRAALSRGRYRGGRGRTTASEALSAAGGAGWARGRCTMSACHSCAAAARLFGSTLPSARRGNRAPAAGLPSAGSGPSARGPEGSPGPAAALIALWQRRDAAAFLPFFSLLLTVCWCHPRGGSRGKGSVAWCEVSENLLSL